jgi:hypothetical protein
MADLASALLAGTRKKKFHEMLAEQASSTAPTAHWGAALARALQGGMAGLIERGERNSDGAEFDRLFGQQAAAPQPTMQAQSQPPIQPTQPEQKPSLVASLSGKRPVQVIEGNAETQPSPLDPPSGQDRDLAIRTMYGEDPNASALGVANVIRRRAIDGNYGGSTPSQVVMAKGQFEPWARPDAKARMMGLSPDSPTYQRLGQTLDQAYAGDDPTGGATHFYAPKAQAALGRQAPSWDKGPSTTIGPHKFLGGVEQGAVPPEAQLAQGQMPPQMAPQQPARAAPQIPPHIMGQARQLWQEGNRSAAAALMQPYLTPKDQWEVTPSPIPGDKNMYQRNRGSNELKPLNPQPFAVNIDQKGQSEFEKEYGKGISKQALDVVERGNSAAVQKQRIMLAQRMMEDISTGSLTPAASTVGGWMQAMGIKPEALGIDPKTPMTAQALTALTSELVIGKIGSGGFPANNFSNPDREFLVQGVFKLADRPEANFIKLELAKRVAALDEQKADAWAEARADGQSYEKFERDWRKQLGSQSIFGDLIEQAKAFGERKNPAQPTQTQQPSQPSNEDLLKKWKSK